MGEMGERHEDIQRGYFLQPSPAGTLICHCSWGCCRVLGVQAGRGQAASPPQPLSATISHGSAGPWGSAVSLGWEGCCLGSQTPGGRWGWFPPFSQQGQTACPKNRDTPFQASSLGGWLLFWRDKIMQEGDPGEAEQFSRLSLKVFPPEEERVAGQRGWLLPSPAPRDRHRAPEPSAGPCSQPLRGLEEYRWLMPSACMKYPICWETKGALCY